MKLGHVAVWTAQLETLKDFYVKYFDGTAGEKYVNPTNGLTSYFISFAGEASFEIMQRPDVQPKPDTIRHTLITGYTHMAFDVERQEMVDALARTLQQDGYTLEKLPRMTGDGFYETAIFDPDGNIVEIAWQPT